MYISSYNSGEVRMSIPKDHAEWKHLTAGLPEGHYKMALRNNCYTGASLVLSEHDGVRLRITRNRVTFKFRTNHTKTLDVNYKSQWIPTVPVRGEDGPELRFEFPTQICPSDALSTRQTRVNKDMNLVMGRGPSAEETEGTSNRSEDPPETPKPTKSKMLVKCPACNTGENVADQCNCAYCGGTGQVSKHKAKNYEQPDAYPTPQTSQDVNRIVQDIRDARDMLNAALDDAEAQGMTVVVGLNPSATRVTSIKRSVVVTKYEDL